MLDQFNRNITYLRISVTDRCNLRCHYCMPAEGVQWIPHNSILSFEEITEVVKVAVGMGVNKIRLTGGEPLVRKGIVDLIKMMSGIPGVEDLAMTTNGILLEKYAADLAAAGLKRVNVSLDTLDPEKYNKLTRGGDMAQVMKGIDAAVDAGLLPVKINCVQTAQTTSEEKEQLRDFCEARGFKLRFIRQMSLTDGSFYPVEGGDGGRCSICNRIRLTAKGDVVPCLFSDYGYNVREYGIEEAILKAVGKKPATGHKNNVNAFYNIGG
ncbi:MAG: GTP 3',8-cyclase MoaA [Bacteroidales bacterium]|nr:GTP 3',8-cyclase MoaA [Bacteroidales bacterium]